MVTDTEMPFYPWFTKLSVTLHEKIFSVQQAEKLTIFAIFFASKTVLWAMHTLGPYAIRMTYVTPTLHIQLGYICSVLGPAHQF